MVADLDDIKWNGANYSVGDKSLRQPERGENDSQNLDKI